MGTSNLQQRRYVARRIRAEVAHHDYQNTTKLAGGTHLEYDKSGVPLYAGQVELLDEYIERSWDLYYGRAGNDSLQAASPIHLRSGCRGVVYEAVRVLAHDKLITLEEDGKTPNPAGMRLFLFTVKSSLAKEAPIHEADQFDKTLYDKTVWRKASESMAAYIIRRNQEFKMLENEIAGCAIPDRLQAHLLLKFSGLDKVQRTQVLSSCGNLIDKEKFEVAIRMQFPRIHLGSDSGGRPQRPQRDFQRPQSNFPNRPQVGKPKWKPRAPNGAHVAEQDEDDYDEEVFMGDEQPSDQEEDDQFETSESFNIDRQSFGDDIEGFIANADINNMDNEELECFAAVVQNRFRKQGRKPPPKTAGSGGSGASASESKPYEFHARGTLQLTEAQRKERQAKIGVLKDRSKCHDCGLYGHWSGDECCKKKKAGARPRPGAVKRPGQVLFSFTEGIDEDTAESFMVVKKKKDAMEHPCEHSFIHSHHVQRGANGSSRWLVCHACEEQVFATSRANPAGLWGYSLVIALYHRDGHRCRNKEMRNRFDKVELMLKDAPRPTRRAKPSDA